MEWRGGVRSGREGEREEERRKGMGRGNGGKAN